MSAEDPGILDLILGRSILIVGVEPDDENPELERVYLGARYRWVYALAPLGSTRLGRGHTLTTLPEGVPLYQDPRVGDAYRLETVAREDQP